jgi:hypothetical protein
MTPIQHHIKTDYTYLRLPVSRAAARQFERLVTRQHNTRSACLERLLRQALADALHNYAASPVPDARHTATRTPLGLTERLRSRSAFTASPQPAADAAPPLTRIQPLTR